MKVTNINLIASTADFISPEKKEKEIKNDYKSLSNSLEYPKGFRPFFGARLHRSPQNFYEQPFNQKGMPKTLKDYLYKDYETNSKIPPAELNKMAFKDLSLCKNIEDVKKMFPNEPLFQNLKTLDIIRPKSGYLFQLRAYDYKNNMVLKTGEDLTVYLLKKIFLESKDIEEINSDFEKDRKQDPELERDEDYCNEKYYFLDTTFGALGIKFPDKSYWKSLQANRADKKYNPYTRHETKPRKKPEHRNSGERKPIKLSEQERQRRHDLMVKRWAEMTPEQIQEQIAKMQDGQQNSTMFKYASPIMYIAADMAHLQDRMYYYFQNNKSKLGTEAPYDLQKTTPKQQKALKMFWNEHPKLKDEFSRCIKYTLNEFEKAEEQGDEAISPLLKKALQIQFNNLEKVYKRKISDPEFVRAELYTILKSQMDLVPDVFTEKYINFLINNKLFEQKLIPLCIKQKLSKTEEERKKYEAESYEVTTSMFNDFVKNNKRDSLAAIAAMATVIRPFLINTAMNLKDTNPKYAETLIKDADEMVTGNLTCVLETIEKHKYIGTYNVTKVSKDQINRAMDEYTKGMTDEEVKTEAKNIFEYMDFIVNKSHNYTILDNPEVRNRCRNMLPKIYKKLSKNKEERREFIDFLKDYEGFLKYYKKEIDDYVETYTNKINNASEAYLYSLNKTQMSEFINIKKKISNECFQDYIYESIIDDYLIKKENER